MQTSSHGFLWNMVTGWKALLSPRTPLLAKALIGFGLLYGISPLDFIPDFIPLLGQLDDIGVIVMVIVGFLRMTKGIREDVGKGSTVETTATVRSRGSAD